MRVSSDAHHWQPCRSTIVAYWEKPCVTFILPITPPDRFMYLLFGEHLTNPMRGCAVLISHFNPLWRLNPLQRKLGLISTKIV